MTSTYAYTVALCTHNHADRLVRTLEDLSALELPKARWELVIIDNASRDETPELLSRHEWPAGWSIRVIREEKLGLSNARNRAILEARGEYLIFIDDDETPDSDWLCAYERLIETKQLDAFGGRIRVLFEDARPTWLQDDLLGFLGELNRFDSITHLTAPSTSFYGGNFGFRKSVIDRVGGFDATLGRKGNDNTGGEEVDFYRRLLSAGYKVWWTPEAVIYHRIQAVKLSRRYFLDLHFCQGRMEGCRQRGMASRAPPFYLVPQLWRAIRAAAERRLQQGSDHSLRLDMNVVYFMGFILSWAFGKR